MLQARTFHMQKEAQMGQRQENKLDSLYIYIAPGPGRLGIKRNSQVSLRAQRGAGRLLSPRTTDMKAIHRLLFSFLCAFARCETFALRNNVLSAVVPATDNGAANPERHFVIPLSSKPIRLRRTP